MKASGQLQSQAVLPYERQLPSLPPPGPLSKELAGPQDRSRRLTTLKYLCPYLPPGTSRYARTT